MKYTVQIKQHSDDGVIKELGPFKSEQMAEKCEDGANINLNHDEYYTTIEEEWKTKTPQSGEDSGVSDDT